MGKPKHPALNREENHLVKATIIIDGAEINDIPCKIYLPERTHEKPYLVFKPSKVDGVRAMSARKGGFRADIYGFDGKLSKSEQPKLEKTQRQSIYSKLGELNRISLREAFDMFCTAYHIDLADLWPVFGNKEIAGLVEIRNKLIHGDPFPFELYSGLVTAKFHLEVILERMLLRVLGWNINNSKVNPAYIERNYKVPSDLLSQQQKLKEFVLSQVAKN